MHHRIYNEPVRIDPQKINLFFEKRFSKDNTLASVMLRANEDGIAEKRNDNEVLVFQSLVKPVGEYSILDIGCGLGRWVDNLRGNIAHYDGIDFTRQYIDSARNMYSQCPQASFHHMSALDMDRSKLASSYDIIIITALCLYLNDEDINHLFATLSDYTHANSLIYLRESVSVLPGRLTLKDFPSEELHVEYNAIYRTSAEYEKMLRKNIASCEILSTELLLTKELGAREETNQRYWLCKVTE